MNVSHVGCTRRIWPFAAREMRQGKHTYLALTIPNKSIRAVNPAAILSIKIRRWRFTLCGADLQRRVWVSTRPRQAKTRQFWLRRFWGTAPGAVPQNPCFSVRDAHGKARVSAYPEFTLLVTSVWVKRALGHRNSRYGTTRAWCQRRFVGNLAQ